MRASARLYQSAVLVLFLSSSHLVVAKDKALATTENPVKTPSLIQAFTEKAELSSSVFLFARDRERYERVQIPNISARDRYDLIDRIEDRLSGYQSDLSHTTLQAALTWQTDMEHPWLSYQLSLMGATDLTYDDKATRNVENEFSFAGDKWGQEEGKADSDIVVMANALTFKFWQQALQITLGNSAHYVPGVIGVNWSNYPGTYQGIQLNYTQDNLKLYAAWSNEYKAPWYRYTQKFYKVNAWEDYNASNEIDYIYGVGLQYQKDSYTLETSYGKSQDYLESYFFKIAKSFDVLKSLQLSYLFYGSDSLDKNQFELYQGTAWQQGLRLLGETQNFNFRIEALVNKAEGFGNYIPRLTRGYANSQGNSEFWWDSRSDWNHDGEKAVFAGIWGNPWQEFGLANFTFGISGAYGWNAKRWVDQSRDYQAPLGKEWALNYDLIYTFASGQLKGTKVQLHYTDYNNQQDEKGSWYYPNMFTSEHDIKLNISFNF